VPNAQHEIVRDYGFVNKQKAKVCTLLKNLKQVRQLKALKIKYRTDVIYIYEKLEKFFSAAIN